MGPPLSVLRTITITAARRDGFDKRVNGCPATRDGVGLGKLGGRLGGQHQKQPEQVRKSPYRIVPAGALTFCVVDLRGFEPLTPSMRTTGATVAEVSCAGQRAGSGFCRSRSVGTVAVLRCCTAVHRT